jgi:hypothetical protein
VCKAEVVGAACTASNESADSILTTNNAVMATAIGFASFLAFSVFAIASVFMFFSLFLKSENLTSLDPFYSLLKTELNPIAKAISHKIRHKFRQTLKKTHNNAKLPQYRLFSIYTSALSHRAILYIFRVRFDVMKRNKKR